MKLAFLFFASLILPTASVAQDWVEPDDIREYARIALLDFETPALLSSPDDIDWYRISVPRDGVLTVAGEIELLSLTLTDADGAAIESEPTQKQFPVAPGLYYLSVQGPARTSPYAFTVSLSDPHTLSEAPAPDGILAEAQGRWPIRSGTQNSPLNFALTLEEPSLFSARLTYQTEDQPRYRVTIADTAGTTWPENTYWPEATSGGPSQWVTAYHLAPGDYTVSLFRDQTSENETMVDFSVAPPNDGFEPNDTPDLAKQVDTHDALTNLALFPGDEDWFYIEAETGGVLELSGLAEFGTNWSNVPWPDVLQGSPDGPTIGYHYSETGFARYWLSEPGRYYLRARASDAGPIAWTLRTKLYDLSAPTDSSTEFFVMGLDPGEALATTLERVASAGGGDSLPVSADEMELGLTLAKIVGSGGGRDLDVFGYTRAVSQVVNQRLFEREREPFDPTASIGTEFLASAGVFEPHSDGAPDLARTARDTFTSHMLSPFKPKPEAEN